MQGEAYCIYKCGLFSGVNVNLILIVFSRAYLIYQLNLKLQKSTKNSRDSKAREARDARDVRENNHQEVCLSSP